MEQAEFLSDLASVRAARDFVQMVLERHGIDSVVALVVVSELATNVVRHAQSPYTVQVEVLPTEIRLAVEDRAAAQEVVTDMADHEGGWGLKIIEGFATAWGVEPHDHGKVVWAKLPKED